MSVPSVPTTVAVNSGSTAPYVLLSLFAVTVTGFGVIVNSSVPVNSPVYFSLVARTCTVLLSLTFVAVISDGFVVQSFPLRLYSIFTLAVSAPSTLPVTFAVPA